MNIQCPQCGASFTPKDTEIITCPSCGSEVFTFLQRYECKHCGQPNYSLSESYINAIGCEHCRKVFYVKSAIYELDCEVSPAPINLYTTFEWKNKVYTIVSYVVYQWWDLQENETGKIEIYSAMSDDGEFIRIIPDINKYDRNYEINKRIIILEKRKEENLQESIPPTESLEKQLMDLHSLTYDKMETYYLSDYDVNMSFEGNLLTIKPIKLWGASLSNMPWYEPAFCILKSLDVEDFSEEKEPEEAIFVEAFDFKYTNDQRQDLLLRLNIFKGKKFNGEEFSKAVNNMLPADIKTLFPESFKSKESFSVLSGGLSTLFVPTNYPEFIYLIPESAKAKKKTPKSPAEVVGEIEKIGEKSGCLSIFVVLIILIYLLL